MRYLALTENDRKSMLAEIGVSSVNDLYDAVENQFLLKNPITGLPFHQGNT